MLSLAYTIKGEIHRVEADQDEIVLGDVEDWKRILAQACIEKALDLNQKMRAEILFETLSLAHRFTAK